MVEIICKTNLDLTPAEKWPNELPECPRIGDYIRSKMKWGIAQLELEVINVTWIYLDGPDVIIHRWVAKVELHDKRFYKRTIADFYKWYAPMVGRQVSSFI